MDEQTLQPFIASARSVLLLVQKFDRVCVAIVLASLTLSAACLLQPCISAQAGSISIARVGEPTALASKPISKATAQLPPHVARQLRQTLSQQTKIPAAQLKLLEATPKDWTNGCLDLARSDEICTQAIVKGWRVIFSHGKQRWIYHTGQEGRFPRLEPQK